MDVTPPRRSENLLDPLMLEFTVRRRVFTILFASLDPPLSQDQLLKLIFFIPVPQFPHDYMKITTLVITIHGRYLRAVMGSSG